MKITLSKWLFSAAILFSLNAFAADEAVTVKPLSQISIDEIGLIENKTNGGLGNDIWNNSERSFAESLISAIPANSTSEAAKSLRRRLLLGAAALPAGESTSGISIIETRLKLLISGGEAESIANIMKLIPEDRQTESVKSIYTASLFLEGEYRDACNQVTALRSKATTAFINEAAIICQAYDKKANDVELSINLLKEDGTKIPEGFQQATESFIKGKADDGKKKWADIIKSEFLTVQKAKADFPPMATVTATSFTKQDVAAWLKKIESMKESDKIAELSRFYQLAAATGTTAIDNEWANIIKWSIGSGSEIPAIALSEALKVAAANNRKGDVVALSIIALGDKPAKDISRDVLVAAISALHATGFKTEAVSLAVEAGF